MFKKLIILAVTGLFAVTVQAQTVKLSALPTASSIAGSEQVLILQSSVDKTATVAQITAAANAAAAAVQLYAAGLSNLVTGAFAPAIKSSNFVNTVQLASSNFLSALQIASSNFLNGSQISSSNFVANYQLASSNFLSAAQVASSNFQSGAQVTTSINSALANIGAVTNAGSAMFNSLTVSNIIVPTLIAPTVNVTSAGVQLVCDCSMANFFTFNVSSTGGSWDLHVKLINYHDGQQIYCVVKINSGSTAGTISTPSVAGSYTGFNFFGTPVSLASFNSGDTWFFNWIFISPNVVFSGAKL